MNKPTIRLDYRYPPRRNRPKRGRWLLVLFLVVLISMVSLGLSRTRGNSRPTVESIDCLTSASCAPTATPLLAYTDQDGTPQDWTAVLSMAPPPEIAGRVAAVIEEPCGALLYGLNLHERLAPASLTKIATALVAAERAMPSAMVDIRVDGAELATLTDSTVMGLKPGQRLSMRDLLYGLLLPSGNDAALAIAEYVGGTVPAFTELMNDKAKRMGLRNTHFTNPHGLDEPGLYTSAFDIAILGRELLRTPELAATVTTRSYQPAWAGPILWNDNPLLYSYPGAQGVKIGYTDEAQQTIVAAVERQGRQLIAVVLKSTNIFQDTPLLLDWAFAQTESACGAQSGR